MKHLLLTTISAVVLVGIGDRYLQIFWYLQIFCAKMIGSE